MYTGLADFTVVYIEEAHPTDGWMYPAVEHFFEQHKEIRSRLKAASVLQGKLNDAVAKAFRTGNILEKKIIRARLVPEAEIRNRFWLSDLPSTQLLLAGLAAETMEIPLYVDEMSNAASHGFGALPERLAIVMDNTVRFIGGPGPGDYSIPAAAAALADLL